jgi:predicted aspartyl protease
MNKSESVANITAILSKFSIGGKMQQGELEKCLEDLKGIGTTLEERDRLVDELKERNDELFQAQQAQLLEHKKREQEWTNSPHQQRFASNQFSAYQHQANSDAMLVEDEDYDEYEDENEKQEIKVLQTRRKEEYVNTRGKEAATADTKRIGFDFRENAGGKAHHKMADHYADLNYSQPRRDEHAAGPRDLRFRPRSNEPRQFSMNSTQPLYKGKFNEDLDEWLWTTETNLNAAGIEGARQVIVAAGYLRENAQQAYRQICTKFKYLDWETFKLEMRARFEYSESTEVLVGKLCALKQEGGVEEYIEKFTYIANRGNLDDAVAVGLFVKGLAPELAGETRYKKPKTLNAAIHVVLDFVQVKLGQKIGQPAATANYVGTTARKDACFKCGTPGHFARDCRKKGSELQRSDRQKGGNRTSGYRQSYKSGSSSDETLKEISRQLSQIAEKCNGCVSGKDEKKKAYVNNRGPPQRSETFHKREQPSEQNGEREIKRAKRRFGEKMDIGNENESSRNAQAGASYIYSIGQTGGGYETKPLFRVTALFNGVETEAFLDTGASITIITKELADAMDVEIDKSKGGSVKLADNSKAKTEGITDIFEIEVEKSSTRIRALVLSAASSPILIGMDWFWATGAIICPKRGTLHFLEDNGHVARMLDLQAPVKRLADAKYLEILHDIGLDQDTEDSAVRVYMANSDVSSDSDEQSSSEEEAETQNGPERYTEENDNNKLSPHVYELFMLNSNKNSLNTEHDSDIDSIDNFHEETTWPIMNENNKRLFETFNEQRLSKEQNEKMRRMLKKYDECFAQDLYARSEITMCDYANEDRTHNGQAYLHSTIQTH